MFLHQVANNNRGAAADTGIAVDKNPATSEKRIVDEAMACCEVLFQVCCRGVQLSDPLIGILLRKFRVKSGANCQNMCNSIT